MIVFNELIKASNNTVDNINYFRIYQLLEENQAEIKHFEDFFLQVNSTISRKSDNIRMLLAKVKSHIAKQHEKNHNYYDALNSCEQALEVLE
jgi:predicted translin family RNA/ssDNA-binding protein